jgi:catechol 2,3-dioxygenase-like lactoylglutathione lyase family enzyme
MLTPLFPTLCREERKSMIKFNGINHLAMATGDMDTTIRFWRDLLGMRLVAGLGKPGYRHYFFEISQTDLLAFFEWPEVRAVPEKDHGYPVQGPFIFDHVSFGVETEDDLWEIQEKLAAAGFWVSEVIDHGFIYSLYSFDPNGIPIEFSHAVAAVDIRREPRMVDSKPSTVTSEGSEPRFDRWPGAQMPASSAERKVYPGEGRELVREEKNAWSAANSRQ